jgi:anti-anti-sigma factor
VSLESWSESIVVGELQDDPAFSDDLTTLIDQVDGQATFNVVLNFQGVRNLTSSNLAKLVLLRKKLSAQHRKLVLCGISTSVWGVFLVTELHNVFDVAEDLSTALASVQLSDASS